MAQFLNAIAPKQPLVLILDDLHCADSASLDMLCHVGGHYPLGRILIAGALRASEASANTALSRLIDQLNRDRLLTALRLAPLGPQDIASLAAGLLDGAIDGTLQRGLYEQSEGNPFFAEELLQCWHESGDTVMRAGSWTLASNFTGNRIPQGITETVRQRLVRHSRRCCQMPRHRLSDQPDIRAGDNRHCGGHRS